MLKQLLTKLVLGVTLTDVAKLLWEQAKLFTNDLNQYLNRTLCQSYQRLYQAKKFRTKRDLQLISGGCWKEIYTQKYINCVWGVCVVLSLRRDWTHLLNLLHCRFFTTEPSRPLYNFIPGLNHDQEGLCWNSICFRGLQSSVIFLTQFSSEAGLSAMLV